MCASHQTEQLVHRYSRLCTYTQPVPSEQREEGVREGLSTHEWNISHSLDPVQVQPHQLLPIVVWHGVIGAHLGRKGGGEGTMETFPV